jgi:hypothetical protein
MFSVLPDRADPDREDDELSAPQKSVAPAGMYGALSEAVGRVFPDPAKNALAWHCSCYAAAVLAIVFFGDEIAL